MNGRRNPTSDTPYPVDFVVRTWGDVSTETAALDEAAGWEYFLRECRGFHHVQLVRRDVVVAQLRPPTTEVSS